MSELIKTIKCSNCGANIQIDFNHPISYCSYCGSALMLDIATVQKWLIEKEKTAQIISKNNAEVEKRKSDNLAKLLSEIAPSIVVLFILFIIFFMLLTVK